MTIAIKVRSAIERSSWIRRMFEEGAALTAEYGAENVFDFTLGNPSVEPPEAFHRELRRIAKQPITGHAPLHEQRRLRLHPRSRCRTHRREVRRAGDSRIMW